MAVEKSPIGWAVTPLKRYAEFSGRSSRAEFWWFYLFLFIIMMVLWFVLVGSLAGLGSSVSETGEPSAGALGAMGGGVILIGLLSLAVLIPTIAVGVRRLHDTNRSGWWLGGFYLVYAVYLVMVVVGCTMQLGAIVDLADGLLFIMAVPNLIGMYLLAPVVKRERAPGRHRVRA